MSRKLLTFLIDDDEDDQEFFSMIVEEKFPFIKCDFANDGMQAIEKFEKDNTYIPELILIDINMPRINGIELLSEIKKFSRLQNSNIYMYSTSDNPVVVNQCLQLGAKGFIKKESTEEGLQKKLSEILSELNYKNSN